MVHAGHPPRRRRIHQRRHHRFQEPGQGEVIVTRLMNVTKPEWRQFFDRFSSALSGTQAEVEVASLDLGDQIIADWIPLQGITYDTADDLLDVSFDRLTHLIPHPRDIIIEEEPAGISSVAIALRDGSRQVIRLKQSLMLPAATGPRA